MTMAAATRCEVLDGDLVIREAGSMRILWNGRPLDRQVQAAIAIPGTDDCAVLLGHSPGEPSAFNVLRCRSDGSVVWRVDSMPNPTQRDAYVHLKWTGDDLQAVTFSGYTVRIDAATGRVTHIRFTK
jgi:hypothetical protein